MRVAFYNMVIACLVSPAGMHAAELTARIRGARSAEAVAELCEKHAAELNHVNLSAALTRLAALGRRTGWPAERDNIVRWVQDAKNL